jgi:hypothetical protein
MEFLPFTYTLTFGTIVTAGLSALRDCITLPHENYLGFFSFRGWMDPSDSELEQNWLIWIFSKYPQRAATPHATVNRGVVFCIPVAQ